MYAESSKENKMCSHLFLLVVAADSGNPVFEVLSYFSMDVEPNKQMTNQLLAA